MLIYRYLLSSLPYISSIHSLSHCLNCFVYLLTCALQSHFMCFLTVFVCFRFSFCICFLCFCLIWGVVFCVLRLLSNNGRIMAKLYLLRTQNISYLHCCCCCCSILMELHIIKGIIIKQHAYTYTHLHNLKLKA